MCQTRCGESREKCIYEVIALNKITSKYYVKSSMSKVGIELFHCITKPPDSLGVRKRLLPMSGRQKNSDCI